MHFSCVFVETQDPIWEKEKMKEKKKKGEGGRVNNFSLQIYIFQMKLFTIHVVDNVDNY